MDTDLKQSILKLTEPQVATEPEAHLLLNIAEKFGPLYAALFGALLFALVWVPFCLWLFNRK